MNTRSDVSKHPSKLKDAPRATPSGLRAVQYNPIYCDEALTDLNENGLSPFSRFDTSHDLSVIDSKGERHKIGTFKHAEWAGLVGKLIEQHGLEGLK